jgi:hypothetical protein
MLNGLKQKFADMGTIKLLSEAAETIGLSDGQPRPGAEHFVLAALKLPDGSAHRVFDQLGLTGALFADALKAEQHAALRRAGVDVAAIAASEHAVPPLHASGGWYAAAPSGAFVMQGLATLRKKGFSGPLQGVHVLAVVAEMQGGNAIQAFAALGRDRATLMAAVEREMAQAA